MDKSEESLRSLSLEIASRAGELLRDELKKCPYEGGPSVKDLMAACVAWMDKAAKLAEGRPAETDKDSAAPSLEDARKAVEAAKQEAA